MANNTFKESKRASKNATSEDGCWLTGVSAIVADNNDPERQHRIRVIIPSIDEDLIFDEWARQFVFCLGNGFGSAFIPKKGSEVILFGCLGQKYNLFYASVYNEEMSVPEGFNDEMTVGINVPGNLHLIAQEVAKILGENIEINADQLTKVLGNNVTVEAQQLAKLKGNQAKVEGSQINLDGGQVTVNSDGSITITGTGNVSISATGVLKLQNRVVNKVGPAI